VEEIPSTWVNWDLTKLLVEELCGLGIAEVEIIDRCYVLARIPANPGKEGCLPVTFIAI
jgi:tripeptide aminopeptidase